jgi:hypothetical protein
MTLTSKSSAINPLAVSVLAALLWAGCHPMAARANVIYTWVEDDGQQVTGNLAVLGTAQPAGQINFADVVSFNWHDPHTSYTTPNLDAGGLWPIAINTLTAAFTGASSQLDAIQSANVVVIQANVNYATPSAESWRYPTGPAELTGVGHWTISGVPEPGGVGLMGIAAALLLRRSRRRPAQINAGF